MMNTKTIKTVFIYGFTHLLTDAACMAALFSTIYFNALEQNFSFFLIVLYNVLAFGLQSIIGDIFDKNKQPKLCAITGCILTAIAVLLWQKSLICTVLAGIGNAFFHLGGGIICLKKGQGKAAIPGMYVAPGAFGLFFGLISIKNGWFRPEMFALLHSFAILFIIFDKLEIEEKQENLKYNNFVLIANFLLLAIVIRSFIGLSINLDWKDNINLILFLTLAVVGGKFLGGIIADKFGWIRTSVIALLISSPLIAFGINYPVLYIIGIFFFNFTMPVTLTALANMMKDREGFAFGLTTLALVIGSMPMFAGIKLGNDNAILIFATVVISAVLIYFALKEYMKISLKFKK